MSFKTAEVYDTFSLRRSNHLPPAKANCLRVLLSPPIRQGIVLLRDELAHLGAHPSPRPHHAITCSRF